MFTHTRIVAVKFLGGWVGTLFSSDSFVQCTEIVHFTILKLSERVPVVAFITTNRTVHKGGPSQNRTVHKGGLSPDFCCDGRMRSLKPENQNWNLGFS